MSTDDHRNDSGQANSEYNGHNPNMDPSPAGDPDLDAGGSVKPGGTPPDSNSASASPPHPAPSTPPKSNLGVIAIGVVIAIIVLIFIAYAVGLFTS